LNALFDWAMAMDIAVPEINTIIKMMIPIFFGIRTDLIIYLSL
jgi:hypothetical protein